MFLATTARTDFWDTSQPMLFLSEACLRRDRRQDWEHLERRVLPSPWDDREAFHRAAQYLDEYSERLIPLLAEFLNSLHGVHHDARYWRILMGQWLVHALHVYYDRWVSVREALGAHPDLTTFVVHEADHRYGIAPEEWVRLSLTDDFNLQLYSEVFSASGCDFPSRRLVAGESAPARAGIRERARDAVRRTITATSVVAAAARKGGVLLHSSGYVARTDMAKMMAGSGFRIWPFEPVDEKAKTPEPSEPRRDEILGFPAADAFERFFHARLARMLPVAVVEQYQSKLRLAHRVSSSGVLATFGGWYSSEAFRFTAAEAHAGGARLAGIQHGGGYGIMKAAPAEKYEQRVADQFLAWGWADEGKQTCLSNVPAGSLARFRNVKHDPAAKDILFLATEHPRYLYRFHSVPVSSQWERYYEWQACFLETLPSDLRPDIRFRGNPYFSAGQGQRERLASRFPWLQWDDEPQITESLRRARVVVADHHSTSFLQVLVAGVPLILFWDPQLWELRPDAEDSFADLRRSGILFDDPVAAAEGVARAHGESRDAWWMSADVLATRTTFLNRFARISDRWRSDWTRTLAGVNRRQDDDTRSASTFPKRQPLTGLKVNP